MYNEISKMREELSGLQVQYWNLYSDLSTWQFWLMFIFFLLFRCSPFIYLGSIVFKGDYFKINKAKTTINQCLYKEAEKVQLIEFLKYVSKNGIEKAKKIHSRYLYKKSILQLESLNINPILIPKNRQDFPSFLKNPFNI